MVTGLHRKTNWKVAASQLLRSRMLLLAGMVLVVIFIVLKGFLPLLVSTTAVKTSMEDALSSWTGAQATIVGEPDIRFWPNPTITLHRVRIESRDPEAPEELARAKAVSADFSIMAALRGEPVFYNFQLVDPIVRIERDADGKVNWKPGGRLAKAVSGMARGAGGTQNDDALGTVVVSNGALLFSDRQAATDYRITGIGGTVKWPTLQGRLSGSLSAKINEEAVDWSFSSDQPLRLFSENNANVRMTLTSKPLTASFEGIGNLSANPFASGTLSASTPSFSSLLSWSGIEPGLFADPGPVTIEAKVATTATTVKLDDLRLGLQKTQGRGILDMSLPPGKQPQISGTLALNEVDLKPLFRRSPRPFDDTDLGEILDTDFLQKLRLDLRLSLERATFDAIQLTEVAAGVLVENGRAALNIGSSVFADGDLTGRITVSQEGFEGGADLQLSLKNADFGSAINTLGLKGPLPVGRGTVNLTLASGKPLWATSIKDISGRFSLNADRGVINNFNEPAFEALISQGAFFNLARAANGSFDFVSLDVQADIASGLAELNRAVIAGSEKVVKLSGVIPYSTGSLALAGSVEPLQAQDGQTGVPLLNFFVGGSWPEPVISPLSVLTDRPY